MSRRTSEILAPIIVADVLLVIVPFAGLSVARAVRRDRARRAEDLTPPR